MEIKNTNSILVVGDNHGKYDSLFNKIKSSNISDCVLIHVGDGGEGFLPYERQLRQFQHFNDFFQKYNIEYLSIRGNHSDPAYFDGSINLSNFKLLQDYTTLTLNDKKFLFVGGAISIDRALRKQGLSYWSDEGFKLDHSKIRQCDVLITHSAPTWNGPIDKSGIMAHYCQKDETLWDECMNERREHDILVQLAEPKRHYCGHFHTHSVVDFYGCVSTILDELEIAQIQ
jgi:hypothetical protein